MKVLSKGIESREVMEQDDREPRSLLRRVVSWFLSIPANACSMVCRAPKVSSSRRALLQGRLWQFIPPERFPPLVTRLPHPNRVEGKSKVGQPRILAGISLEPVAPTDWTGTPGVTRPVHRPPGAIAETQFLAGCTRCGDCMEACPHEAIRKAPERLGAIAGTPIIEADVAACMMCEDFPCIAACEPGVLVDSIAPIMGTARVTAQLCLAYHRTLCTVCSERCPVPGAIKVTEGRPSVDEAICTGCGVCRYVCPAPENAILLMPAFARPGLPTR
jgi:MauM/NapG family ferredoxin protein